jgi:hypothetical protein
MDFTLLCGVEEILVVGGCAHGLKRNNWSNLNQSNWKEIKKKFSFSTDNQTDKSGNKKEFYSSEPSSFLSFFFNFFSKAFLSSS